MVNQKLTDYMDSLIITYMRENVFAPIKKLEISNFKSIRSVSLETSRINIFIGEPNSGKTNILEALTMFSYPHLRYLKGIIRYNEPINLFYDHDITQPILIKCEIGSKFIDSEDTEASITIDYNHSEISFRGEIPAQENKQIKIVSVGGYYTSDRNEFKFNFFPPPSLIKPFKFKVLDTFEGADTEGLRPPYGNNLVMLLKTNKELRKNIAAIFSRYGLKLAVKFSEKKLELQKESEGIIIAYPYNTISDTLLRVVFYISAIKTNKNSVLIFDEPESYAFPYYTKFIAEEIAQDITNQYFLSTHNPYLILSILEKAHKEDVNIFVTHFEDYETKVKLLSPAEKEELLEFDADLFFNLEKFFK